MRFADRQWVYGDERLDHHYVHDCELYFPADVGAAVTGTDIPSYATISTVSSSTKIIISAAATGSASSVGLTLGVTNAGTDYIFFSLNRGTKGGCTSNTAGNGCILSYTVNSPATVTISGSGQNVLTPSGTAGCWATGGLVIDNSATSPTGASEVYFVGLNGNAAGGQGNRTSTNCTSASTAIINATQASQASP